MAKTQADQRPMLRRAIQLVAETMDNDGYNDSAAKQTRILVAEFGISKERANTLLAKAARTIRAVNR